MEKHGFERVDDYQAPMNAPVLQVFDTVIELRFPEDYNICPKRIKVGKHADLAHIDKVSQYINYFEEYYDEEHELLDAYHTLLNFIEFQDYSGNLDEIIETTRKTIYKLILTQSMKKKICKFVEDNYVHEVLLEGHRFSNTRAKTLHKIAMSYKLMLPMVYEFVSVTNSNTIDVLRLMNAPGLKLYPVGKIGTEHSLRTWINWSMKRALETEDVTQYADIVSEILNKDLLCNTMYKYDFRINVIAFTHVVIRSLITYYCALESSSL